MNKRIKYAFFICSLFITGLVIGRLGQSYFRFSGYRFLYHTCWITNYILILSSFTWGIINAILVFKEKYNLSKMIICLTVSLLPIIYILIMIGLISMEN
ncbi:hypothetical protein C8P67_102305 [Flavobacterium aquicola]|uniref:Uncharacterized protein n=1 Tax=Flavobacterium aquicola TaxID=1682742 RepID=A0A3E0ES42_9FLAO|nr:hypothetical protein C8P67_102305 [Flavobacterium aquicola]